MSIFGATKAERFARVHQNIRICDDCRYDGYDFNREQDVCDDCGKNSPAHGPDLCIHCGASNCMMMACPDCGGRLSLNYEVMQPLWDSHAAFCKFDRRAALSRGPEREAER